MPEDNNKDLEVISKKSDGPREMVSREVFYSAPLPPAAEFEKYERVLKGAADRIIRLAENQNRHRRFIENIVVIFDAIKSLGGLISALIIVLAGIGAGTYLILNDKSTEGLTALFFPMVAVIGAFLYEKGRKTKDHSEE